MSDVESQSPVSDGPPSEPVIGFADLGLPEALLRALRDVGYESPSPIQAATIPPLLEGRDVLGQAQTGTGKTAAFALPILARVDAARRETQALVLAPTRELAIQVAEAFSRYASHLPGFHVLPVYGGQSYTPQLAALRRGAQVVVGTPGRIIDHLDRGTLKLDSLRHLVLDEADEMLRMGFIDDVERILASTPPQRQVALFSATMPSAIRAIAQRHLREPAQITIKARTRTASGVQQRYWMVSGMHKLDALTRILEVETFEAMIVFARTKVATEELAEKLAARGFATAALNGDIQQAQRERTVQRLKDGQVDILVATDVAARGLDVDRISHVVNYDIPTDTESYVHRIGRTGRAGRSGQAILFVTPRERYLLQSIERATRQRIEPMQLPSVEAVNDRRTARFFERISETREQDEALRPYLALVERYEREHNVPAVEIAAALASMVQGGKPLLLGAEEAAARPRAMREPYESRAVRETRAAGEEPAPRPARPAPAGTPRSLEQLAAQALADFEHSRAAQDEGDGEGPRRRRAPAGALQTYRVEIGREHGVEVRNLVGAIANETGMDNSRIGNIAIRRDYSLVELPADMPRDVLRMLQRLRVLGRPLQLAPAEESAAAEPRPSRKESASYKDSPRAGASRPPARSAAPRAKAAAPRRKHER
ncbi:DEAD/DEAH box helicase [Thiomonas sp. FB-6]|uniref:DEAD/DEAH box helicase n=1 Tax=Thiomonas sp. FB-6 TaxID=1158291 RepID=UPI0003738E6F|nr:DEAD/DEAH box helicase [Thiomonas sp. FB-6]